MLELSFNQKTVHELLQASDRPLKAYTILSEIQKLGIKSPTQVYRALEKLIELGIVHKIESKNSYIVCKINNCSKQLSTSFLMCNKCDNVVEIEDYHFEDRLNKLSKKFNTQYLHHKLEIYGTCEDCIL